MRAVSKNNQIDSPTPIGLVRKDKRNLPSYLILRTPIYTEVGVVSELYRYRLSRPPDDLNILRWVLIRSAVTVLRYIIKPDLSKLHVSLSRILYLALILATRLNQPCITIAESSLVVLLAIRLCRELSAALDKRTGLV